MLRLPKGVSSPVLSLGLPFIICFLGVRLVFWFAAFPNPDEAYYWLWGRHFEFSYYDHPGLHAWIQGAFTTVLGRSNIVLRLPNLFSNGLLLYTYYQILKYVYGDRWRDRIWLVVILLLSSPLYFLFLAMAWHDHWLVTFSVVSSYLFFRFLDSYLVQKPGDARWLYGAGLALGLAMLCKYNAVFVGLGFLVTVLVNRRLRPLLWDLRCWGAVGLTLLVLSPIVIWNAQNDFFSFRFYSDRSVNAGQFVIKPLEALEFIGFSALILSPFHSWAIYRVWRQQAQTEREALYRQLAFTVFTVSSVILIGCALRSTALYYWNILAYVLLMPLLPGVFLRSQIDPPTRDLSTCDQPSTLPPTMSPTPDWLPGEQPWGELPSRITPDDPDAPAISQLSLLTVAPQSLLPHNEPSSPPPRSPLKYGGVLRWMQGLGLFAATGLVLYYSVFPFSAFFGPTGDEDTRMLFGWSDVAAQVQMTAQQFDSPPLLLTTDYRSASALAYELNDPSVIAISGRWDQFDFWYNRDRMLGRDAILIGDRWHPICPEHLQQFQTTSPPVTIPVRRFGLWIKDYTLITGQNFNPGPSDTYPLSPDYPFDRASTGQACRLSD